MAVLTNQSNFDPLNPLKGISSYNISVERKAKLDKKITDLSKQINNAQNEHALLLAQITVAESMGNSALAAELKAKATELEGKIKALDYAFKKAKKEMDELSKAESQNSDLSESQENGGQLTNSGDDQHTKKFLDDAGNEVIGYYNKTTGEYETAATPLTPGDQIITVDPEAKKILDARRKGAELSCADADIGAFEDEGAIEATGEVVIVNDSDNTLFAGIKIESVSYGDSTVDSLTAQRIKYYQSEDKTRGFIVPWDGRFGQAYSNTQSIGNFMPYGDEWVGSPSLINPYALIRFEHIAGRKHHHHLLDQYGTSGFRGTRWKPYANVKDYESGSNNGSNNQNTVKLSDEERMNLSVLPSDGDIHSDTTGALYVNEVDYSQEIWKPHHVTKYTENGETIVLNLDSTPGEIVIDTPDKQKNSELERLNKLKKTTFELNQNADAGLLTPDQREYWLKQQGWIKCGDLYVEPKYCSGKGNVTGQLSEQEQVQLKEKSIELKRYIDAQVSRNWKKVNNPTKKRYLRKPNTHAVQREVVEPSFDNLCNADYWRGKEQFQYRWSDFLYGQYCGWIPNNYMVTLRRFPMPVNDAATIPDQDKTKQHLLPIATAVGWMGEATGNKVGDLLTFLARMNWRDVNSQINEVQGNEQGAQDSPFGRVGQGFSKWMGMIGGESDFARVSGWDEQRAKFDPYSSGMYANRIYGPVNVIAKTKARERGLEYEHPITLNFKYELRSIGGVNPKAAMLDILANLLALTYNNADFWGGANRYFPNKPAYPFLGAKENMKKWYSGDVTGSVDGLADTLIGAMGGIGEFFQNLITNPKEALSGIFGGGKKDGGALAHQVTSQWMAQKQRDKRPAILTFKALLTGDPVGEWHLVIGNPFNPIAMIGNLIVTGIKISFGDQLGPDDFPTEMVATVTLEHGKPRDKGDIESMFNRGSGRLHYSYFGKNTEFWNQASSTKDSKIDTSWNDAGTTTYDDNFSGKTETAAAYNPETGKGEFSPIDAPNNTAFVHKLSYTGSKAIFNLSSLVGFESGKGNNNA